MDTWQMIRAERESLAADLAALAEDSWDKDSLCTGWSVRDVVGHMIATTYLSPARFFGKLIGSGFSFTTMSDKQHRAVTAGKTPKELAELFRSRVDTRSVPPGPTTSWLGETVIHGEDVFRALGPYRDHPTEHLVAVADFYKNSNLIVQPQQRITGLTLRATDADWSTGTGPEVNGPLVALIMAMTGRKPALDDLTGDGVATLRERP